MERYNKSLEDTTCTLCKGTGSLHIEGDLHESGGLIPCPRACFNGHGYPCCRKGILKFSEYDLENWEELKKHYN